MILPTPGSQHGVALPVGHLAITVTEAAEPLAGLCGFGARLHNPARPFLVVSRVLGKHVPVAPWRMALIHRALADRLPSSMPGPICWIGLAETATGLGAGVHEQWRTLVGRTDGDYFASTRRPPVGVEALTFAEPHSHAVQHWLPAPPAGWQSRGYRTAVLIDDEITTGTTLANLSECLQRALPSLEQIEQVTIIDWSAQDAGKPIALARGQLSFLAHEAPSPWPQTLPDAEVTDTPTMSPHVTLPHTIVAIAERHRAVAGTRTLVLGSGEFLHRPFQFAAALELMGERVWFQSTTRSPAMVWGEIGTALAFADPAEHDERRFLYNATRTAYDRILLCRAQRDHPVSNALVSALDAQVVALDA